MTMMEATTETVSNQSTPRLQTTAQQPRVRKVGKVLRVKMEVMGPTPRTRQTKPPHRLPLTQTPQNRLVSNRTPKPIHPTTDTDEPQTAANTDGTAETTATSDDQDADADEDDTATPTDESTETESETGEETETDTTPTKTKQDYLDEDYSELEAELAVDPPEEHRIKAAMAAAIEFFHQQLDAEIPENREWNRDNPNAAYRKPETPREYFRDPEYDADTSTAVEFNERADLIKQNLTAEDGRAEYEISPAASREIDATTASNDSVITSDEDGDQSNDSVITPDEDGDQSNDSVITPDEDATDADDSESMVLYNYQTRDNRGWSPETIESKKLGWAPRDTDSLREHLLDEGFSIKELFATGLFNDIGDGGLLPFMQARYIIPYFDADGEPVFLISRSIDTDMEQDKQSDFHRPTKYLKPKEAHIEEPIYGTETIEEGKPLVITEGIADAITAHEHDIPCISPVTVQFKDEHYPILRDLIVDNDVPQVFIIQDADPPTTSVPERFTPEYAANYDPEEDADKREPVEIDSLEDDNADRAITVNQKGPGFNGALKTALELDEEARRRGAERSQSQDDTDIDQSEKTETADQIHTVEGEATPSAVADRESHRVHPEACGYGTPDRAFETYLIELPRFGEIKYDLDDYLSDGLATVAPPAMWASDHVDRLTPTTDWVTNLALDGDLAYADPQRYVDTPAVGGLTVDSEADDTTTSQTVPLRQTVLNYLPTITPNHTALSESVEAPYLDTTGSGFDSDLPSMEGGSSTDADMWDLTWRDVFGLDEGYRGVSPFGHIGESRDYFVVISPEKAYCHKRKVTYTPSTGVLVREGERFPEDPEGQLSDWEQFVYWASLREQGIVDDAPPNKALLAYARKHDLATDGDGIETIDGEYGEFDALTKERLYQVCDHIEADYAIDIQWDPYGDRHTESDTTDTSADNDGSTKQSNDSPQDSQAASTSDTDSTSTDSGATTGEGETDPAVEQYLADDDDNTSASDQPGGDDSADESPATSQKTETTQGDTTATDEPAGTDSDGTEIPVEDDSDEDVDELKERRNANRDIPDEREDSVEVEGGTNFHEVMDQMGTDDPHEKFRTYNGPTEPDDDNDDVDVDREAVLQFVEEFTNTDGSGSKELKEHKRTLYDAFNTWAKINDIELNEVSEDVWENHRIGNFKDILENEFELTHSRYTVRGERKKGFAGIRLSDEGYDLVDMEIE